jgi:putative PEP-CTERM system TPR-repeat lipoprotein
MKSCLNSPARRARRLSPRHLLAAVALCSAVLAHAAPEQAAKFYEDALQRYEKGDLAGAAVQLKNTLQADSKMLAAHLLMGKVLLKAGELKAAEAAFEEALRQGVNRSEVAVPLGQVYLQLDETRKLLDRITATGLPPAQAAEVLTLRGAAQAMTGNLGGASQSFAEARAIDPKAAGPLIAEVPILLRAGERDRAKAAAQRATELAPNNAAAWYTLGTVSHTVGDLKTAMTAFDRALAVNSKHVDARISRASLLIALDREKEADQELAQLKAWAVVEPRASFLRGVLASRKGDAATAKAEYSDAVGLIDAMPPALRLGSEPLLMAGALSHRALGNLEKAREYLEALLGRNGRHYAAQLLLASILVDSREYPRALTLLESLQRVTPNEPQVLSMLGTVYLARRQFGPAAEMLERAATLNPSGDAVRELGLSQLALGQDKLGIANLEKVFARNNGDFRAGVQLATLYGRQGNNAKAVQTAETMVKQDPANLTMLNFLGNIKGRIRDTKGAREAFNLVLSKDPSFRPGVINLSWLDIEEGKFDAARARIKQALGAKADDTDLLFQLGTLEFRARRPQEALVNWKRADELLRTDPRAGLAVVELLAAQRQGEAAVAAAKTLVGKYPDNIFVQTSLSRAHLANGEVMPARAVLQEATRMAGFDPTLQVMIGRLQLGAGNPDGAAYCVTKALQSRPDDLGALVLQVEIEARRGNAAGMEAAVKTLSNKYPGSVPALLTTANLAMSRGQLPAAVTAFRAAMDKEPSTGTAIMLAHAHIASQQTDKALQVLDTWSRKSPDDRIALRALAEVQMQAGKNDDARKSYQRALAQDPDEASTLSSYASLLHRLGDPAAAATAEKAVKLAPGNPEFADVLGWILVQQGNVEAGLRHLREARLRDPNNGGVRYHLAYALAKAGRKAEARDELGAMLANASRAPLPPEVTRLKNELGL